MPQGEEETRYVEWPWVGPSFQELVGMADAPINLGVEHVTYRTVLARLQEKLLLDSSLVREPVTKKLGLDKFQIIPVDAGDIKDKIVEEIRLSSKNNESPKIPDFVIVTEDGKIIPVDSKRDLGSNIDIAQVSKDLITLLLTSKALNEYLERSIQQKNIEVKNLIPTDGFFLVSDTQKNREFWSPTSVQKWSKWQVSATENGKTLGPMPTSEQVVLIKLSKDKLIPELPGYPLAIELLRLDYPDYNKWPTDFVDEKDGARKDFWYYSRLGAACLSLMQQVAVSSVDISDYSKYLEGCTSSNEVYKRLKQIEYQRKAAIFKLTTESGLNFSPNPK